MSIMSNYKILLFLLLNKMTKKLLLLGTLLLNQPMYYNIYYLCFQLSFVVYKNIPTMHYKNMV
jgi:hypothetical protein